MSAKRKDGRLIRFTGETAELITREMHRTGQSAEEIVEECLKSAFENSERTRRPNDANIALDYRPARPTATV
jgi:ribosomal protein L14